MKTVSNDFKNAAIAPVKQTTASVTVFNNDGTTTIYSASDVLQSASIESNGELLGTVASTATIKLLGVNYNLMNLDIDILYGLDVNGDYEMVDFGHFVVNQIDVDYKTQTTTVKAISKMLELQNQEYSEIEGFPMTVADMAQAIADEFGLTLSDMSTLPNYNQTIPEDLYKNIANENYRNILAEIAGTTATMAIINRLDSTLFFQPYQSVVQQTLDYTYLKSYTKDRPFGPVNSIVLARTPQEDNIALTDDASVAQYGLTEYKIANNEIMDDDRTSYITGIYNALNGIEWNGFEINTVGLGWLECGDRISITDENNQTIEGIITYIKLTFDGGIKELIKGVPPTETSTNYALAGGITKTIYNTEIKVDKQNQEIQSIVESQETFENEVINNFTNVTQNINSVVTSVQASGGSNLIKNSAFFTSDDSGRFTEWEQDSSTAIIPDEYQQVEYIEGSGLTQWIDTGYIGNLDTQVEIDMMQRKASTNENAAFFGAGDNEGVSITFNLPLSSTYRRSYFGDKILDYNNPLDLNVKYKFITNKTSMSIDGVSIGNFNTTTPFTTEYSGLLFRVGTGTLSNPWIDGIQRIYSCIISENGVQQRNLIPCYRVADRVKGMYDTVNDTFYTNAGDGEDFTAGQAVGIPTVEPSGEAQAYGSLSGQIIHLEDVTISQTIPVKADDESIPEDNKTYYSFSCRCKKELSGTASITITDGTAEGIWTIDLPNGTGSLWEEFSIDAMLPQSNELTITATGSASSDFQVTDLMLCVGDYHSQWQQASGESNNTQVSITTDGVTVKNGNLASAWTKHTPLSFDIYKDRRLQSTLNTDEVKAPTANFTDGINMPPIKIVPQSDGWAFVKYS